MTDLLIDHVLYKQSGTDDPISVAHSPGVSEEIQQQLSTVCRAFVNPPQEWSEPPAILVCFPGKKIVAILQALPGRFYFLLMPQKLYREQGGDPFQLIEKLPALWDLQGQLEPRLWKDAEPSPARRIEDVQAILKSPDGPTLLGASQALLDGANLVLQREKPDNEFLRNLWQLLPVSSRAEMGFATLVCVPGLPLKVVAAPTIEENAYLEHWREDQVGDYPEGRYELHLQLAVESGDQDGMNRLFMRRSPRETIRLGLIILVIALILPVAGGLIGNFLGGKARPKHQGQPTSQQEKPHE